MAAHTAVSGPSLDQPSAPRDSASSCERAVGDKLCGGTKDRSIMRALYTCRIRRARSPTTDGKNPLRCAPTQPSPATRESEGTGRRDGVLLIDGGIAARARELVAARRREVSLAALQARQNAALPGLDALTEFFLIGLARLLKLLEARFGLSDVIAARRRELSLMAGHTLIYPPTARLNIAAELLRVFSTRTLLRPGFISGGRNTSG